MVEVVEEGERRPVNQTKPTWLVLPHGGVIREEGLTKKIVMAACSMAKSGQKETKNEPNQTNMAAVCLVEETKSESPPSDPGKRWRVLIWHSGPHKMNKLPTSVKHWEVLDMGGGGLRQSWGRN
jgi:hypothetical protein